MGKSSRTKGAAGERECVAWLRSIGLETSGRELSQTRDGGFDVLTGIPQRDCWYEPGKPVAIECKRGKSPRLWAALEQLKAAEVPEGALRVVWARRDREEAVVMMSASDFARLVGAE